MKIPTDSFQFELTEKEGKRVLKLNSPDYLQHFLKKLRIGDKGTMHLTFKKPTRSSQQLRYYAVIVGLIADHTGYTWEECHDWLMVLKWGTNKVTIGGLTVETRLSISDAAKFPKHKMIEQIEFAQEKAFELNINIPSAENLGYISNY